MFKQEYIGIFGGSLILLGSLICPWYQLPPVASSSFNIDPFWINLPRLVIAPWIFVCFCLIFFRYKQSARLLFWSGWIIPLLFPYFVHTWLPDVNYLTTAYYQQGRQAALFSANHLPDVQAQWKQNIILEPISPLRTLTNLSLSDRGFFQLSAWDSLIKEGFGYKPSFFTYTRKGWELTMIGLVITLMGFYLRDGFNTFIADLKWVVPIAALVTSCLFFSIIGINIVNYNLDVRFAQGQYHQVIKTSQWLQLCYPPLKADEAFLKRWGKAAFYGDRKFSAIAYFAEGVQQYEMGNLGQAQVDFQRAWELDSNLLSIRGYLSAILINQGVNAIQPFSSLKLSPLSDQLRVPYKRSFLDTSQAKETSPTFQGASAAKFFEQALTLFPAHLCALNYLMLTRTLNNQWDKSAQVAQEIIDLEQYFHPPHLSLLGQAYLHLTWTDYHQGHLETAWQRYRQTVEPKRQKDDLDRGERALER